MKCCISLDENSGVVVVNENKVGFEEKVDEFGIQSLENWELIALVLRRGTSKNPIDRLAKLLGGYFSKLSRYPDLDELLNIDGIGMAKACQLLACLELSTRYLLTYDKILLNTPEQCIHVLNHLKMAEQEEFWVICLDSQSRLISKNKLSLGLVNQTSVHPREAFRIAIKENSVTVIFAHNHPSGDSTPSTQDIQVTHRLIEVGKIVGVEVQDHVIISRKEWHSMRRSGLVWV